MFNNQCELSVVSVIINDLIIKAALDVCECPRQLVEAPSPYTLEFYM